MKSAILSKMELQPEGYTENIVFGDNNGEF
jgi:hypothetical protein